MINLKSLIDLLPPIFKSTDTYKVDGKGLLERFLEICGNYLDDIITPDIDRALDLIKVEETDSIYLNYLWELFGEVPFGNGNIINKGQWDLYYNGTLSTQELEELSKNWIIPKEGTLVLDNNRTRELLKYSLALMKVRGTKKFFETLFKIYGIDCNITDEQGNNQGRYYKSSIVDTEYNSILDKVNLDNTSTCNECLNLSVDISASYSYGSTDGVLMVGIDESVLQARDLTPVDTLTGVNLYNTPSNQLSDTQKEYVQGFIAFRKTIEYLFDKYLPCNTKAVITYNEIAPDDRFELSIEYITENSTLNDEDREVKVAVHVTSLWPNNNHTYQVSSDGINWSNKVYESGSIFTIQTPGMYYFRSVAKPDLVDSFLVVDSRNMVEEWAGDVISIGFINPNITQNLNIPVHHLFVSEESPTGSLVIQVYKGGEVIEGDSVRQEEIIDQNGHIYHSGDTVVFNTLGVYTFSLIRNLSITAKIEVLKYQPKDVNASFIMGMPYGVSCMYRSIETFEDGTSKESGSLNNFGNYGILGGGDWREPTEPFKNNSRGNVINLAYTRGDATELKILLKDLKIWAYKYSDDGYIDKQVIDLDVLDVLQSDQPCERLIYHGDPGATDVSLMIDRLSFDRSSFNLSELSRDYGNEIPLEALHTLSNGGVLLLHPNTNELASKGILPNCSLSNNTYYSNFLVIVIPPLVTGYPVSDVEDFGNHFQTSTTGLSSPNDCLTSGYKRGVPPHGLSYDYIEPGSTYDTQGNLTGLTYGFKNYSYSTDMTDKYKFKDTKVVIFNLDGYSSNNSVYYPRENTYYEDGIRFDRLDKLHEALIPPEYNSTVQFNRTVIFMDRLAPFVNTQYVMYNSPTPKDVDGTILNGLYIKPKWYKREVTAVDIEGNTLNGDEINEAIWRTYTDSGWWDNVLSIGLVKPRGVANYVSIAPFLDFSDNSIKPAMFEFIYYTYGVDISQFSFVFDKEGVASIPYYIVDDVGNLYLPKNVYSISDQLTAKLILLPFVSPEGVSPMINLDSSVPAANSVGSLLINGSDDKVYTYKIPSTAMSIQASVPLNILNPVPGVVKDLVIAEVSSNDISDENFAIEVEWPNNTLYHSGIPDIENLNTDIEHHFIIKNSYGELIGDIHTLKITKNS